MYNALVCNFEALINEEEAIPMELMLIIDKLRTNNIKLIVTTTKNYEDILAYNKSYPFLDYIIAYNGALVYDVNKEKVIYNKPLATTILNKIKTSFSSYQLLFHTWNNKTYQVEVANISTPKFLKIISTENIKVNNYTEHKNHYLFNENTDLLLAVNKIKKSNFSVLAIGLNKGDKKNLEKFSTKFYVTSCYEIISKLKTYFNFLKN